MLRMRQRMRTGRAKPKVVNKFLSVVAAKTFHRLLPVCDLCMACALPEPAGLGLIINVGDRIRILPLLPFEFAEYS